MRGFNSRPGLNSNLPDSDEFDFKFICEEYSKQMQRFVSERWNEKKLRALVASSFSVREVLSKLNLKPAGGNYTQFKSYTEHYGIDTSHFTGQGWQRNRSIHREPLYSLQEILTENSLFQSNKLKIRLFRAGLKKPACEECGWAEMSEDGRTPVELDHINGDHYDNRLENLRILCPNCHSLKPTHRGSNIGRKSRGGEIGIHATLKTL